MRVYKEFTLKNGESLIVRSEEEVDAEITLEVYKQKTKETRFLSRGESDKFPTAEEMREAAKWFLEDEKSCTVVAVYQNKIVGTGHIEWYGGKVRSRHTCNLDLGVLKEFWELGIGGKIMEVLIGAAKQGDLEQIELMVVEDNQKAIKMYESFGFVATGKQPHAMKYEDGTYADMILMTKPLIDTFTL